ncbi:MAG: lamin tail domain-containing protein, partial [Actinomycetota bacterium]|nr:lamin tail domain-containing protein [Actinomycetota bacterium]
RKAGEDPFYPQGLEVDGSVVSSLEELRPEYPTIEFFSYDIDNPGTAETSEDLQPGQYGTLAAQLGVGYTPFFATLAPRDDKYIIENLFQGYVPQPVLNQALFDLSNADVEGNTSDVDVVLSRIELTETGGGLEYFTVQNRSDRPVNLQGFSLRVLDPETGEVNPDSDGVLVNDEIMVRPGQEVSVGRVPDVVNAEGNRVAGTFEGGGELGLAPGDQLALLDSGGAVASTITV